MRTTAIQGIGPLYDEIRENTAALAVVNRDGPAPLQQILERLFDRQPVEVVERTCYSSASNTVELLEAGEVITSSPLEALAETILLVNSDRYMTGLDSSGSESFPAVLANLDEVPFTVRGYPHAHREKLLFIAMSRLIEQRALAAGNGRLRAAFQHVSRLLSEPATRRMYRALGATDIDLRLFGYGKRPTEDPFAGDLTLDDRWTHRNCWVVSYEPSTSDDAGIALLAIETGPNLWDGFWTFDRSKIATINRWVDQSLATDPA